MEIKIMLGIIFIIVIFLFYIAFKKTKEETYHHEEITEENHDRRNSTNPGRRISDWVNAYDRKEITKEELIDWLENKLRK